MFASHNSHTAVAKMTVRRSLLDREIAEHHQSLATFAHELELMQERHRFGLATRHDLEAIEDQLVAVWHGMIEVSSRDLGH
jgi:hypothetical protein